MRRRHRVPTPVLVGGLAAALVGTVAVLTLVEPAVSTTPDLCSRFAQESQDLAASPTGSGRRIAVIGDSYAAGLALEDPGAAWTSRLPGQVQVFAFSGSGFGRYSSQCGSVAYAERAVAVEATDPEFVVVEGGLNDIGQSEEEIRSGFQALLDALGDVPVLVVGPALAPSRDNGALRVDRILRDMARQTGTPYLSMIGQRFEYLEDQLHLTAEGHQEFGDVVAQSLRSRPLGSL